MWGKDDQAHWTHRQDTNGSHFAMNSVAHQDRGVSPVIGVILMVAITVILAAIVGAFVLDIGQQAENDSPQASFSVTAGPANNEIKLEHLGGDRLRHDETRVVVESNGTTQFAAATASQKLLSVGVTAVITLNDTNDDSLDFDGDGSPEATVNGSAGTFDSGDYVTVTLIDTETDRVIFEREVLVQN